MSLLDHIRICNSFDLSRFRPFKIERRIMGWVRAEFALKLAQKPELFLVQPHAVTLSPALTTPTQRTEAIDGFLRGLRAEGMFRAWRDERYPVTARFGQQPVMEMERAAVASFGLRAYGVHLTGYVRRPDGLHIWVATRAHNKPTYPGMLDNTVAGGQPIGIGLHDNLIKECAEEASIPRKLAEQAKAVSYITYLNQSGPQLKPDIMTCFDLELPEDFTPHANDGEVHSFELWPVRRVFETVRDTTEFKYNCNLVLIDFFVRHGLLSADDPQFMAIVSGLKKEYTLINGIG